MEKNGTLLIAFLRQMSSVCPSNASLNDEADKNHLVPVLGCMKEVYKLHEPQTLDFCQCQLLFSVFTNGQVPISPSSPYFKQ